NKFHSGLLVFLYDPGSRRWLEFKHRSGDVGVDYDISKYEFVSRLIHRQYNHAVNKIGTWIHFDIDALNTRILPLWDKPDHCISFEKRFGFQIRCLKLVLETGLANQIHERDLVGSRILDLLLCGFA